MNQARPCDSNCGSQLFLERQSQMWSRMVRYDNMSERSLVLVGIGLWSKVLFDACSSAVPMTT